MYTVDCGCGKQIPVEASQSGLKIDCSCGRSVNVPPLSQLRQAAGQGSYDPGVVGAIKRMIESGELPWGDECAICGLPTKDFSMLRVHCERQWAQTGQYKSNLALLAIAILTVPFGFWRILMRNEWEDRPVQVHGRDTIVEVPLCVRSGYQKQLQRLSQRKLRKALRVVPIYAQLLDEYPEATIEVRSGPLELPATG